MENGPEKGHLKMLLVLEKTSGTTNLFLTFSYYIVESASGHDEKNPEF